MEYFLTFVSIDENSNQNRGTKIISTCGSWTKMHSIMQIVQGLTSWVDNNRLIEILNNIKKIKYLYNNIVWGGIWKFIIVCITFLFFTNC